MAKRSIGEINVKAEEIGLVKYVEVDGLDWELYAIDKAYLKALELQGYHISDWVWKHAKYEAYCPITEDNFFVSHFYKRDIRGIMCVGEDK